MTTSTLPPAPGGLQTYWLERGPATRDAIQRARAFPPPDQLAPGKARDAVAKALSLLGRFERHDRAVRDCLSQRPAVWERANAELEAAVDQAIAACEGDLRATIRGLVIANNFLETEVSELMKAVSHAYTRGRFHTYSG